MKKFSTMRPTSNGPKKVEPIYQDDYVSIVEFEDWKIIDQPDVAVAIIYLMEENLFILRHEYIPTFKWKEGQDYHLTLVGGTIENGETPEKALIREIEEEAGIVISPDFKLEMMKPLYLMKGSSSQVHPALVVLNENQYHEVLAKGDGSKVEKMSKSVKIDVKFINKVNCSDLITEYMLGELKKYLNIV
jgi:8-oxo-dGTP pyrophosphatase MutT (NUDIX family)